MRVVTLCKVVSSSSVTRLPARWAVLAGGGLQPCQGAIRKLEACISRLGLAGSTSVGTVVWLPGGSEI